MKQIVPLALTVLAFASLSACGPNRMHQASDPPPYRSSTGSLSGTPQSPNSLPDGAAVNAPLTAPTGGVTTTVPPSTAPVGRRSSSYR